MEEVIGPSRELSPCGELLFDFGIFLVVNFYDNPTLSGDVMGFQSATQATITVGRSRPLHCGMSRLLSGGKALSHRRQNAEL